MTNDIKAPQREFGLLAAELKKLEGLGTVAADLKRLQTQTLSISSAVASGLAAHSIAADFGRLYSDRVEGIARDVRNSLSLMDSNIARATSALTLARTDWSSQAIRTLEITTAAHPVEIRKQLDQVASSINFSKVFEQAAKSLDLTKHVQQASGSFDYVKDAAAAARSIINSVNLTMLPGRAATLNVDAILKDLRASTAITVLSTGPLAAQGVLHLSSIPEAVREVVQRHVAETSVATAPTRSPTAASSESAVPADNGWEPWLQRQPMWVRLLFWSLITLLLGPMLHAYWDVQMERWLGSHTPEARTQIESEVQRDFGSDYLNRLRYAKGTLRVREAPRTDASIVDRLSAGQPVELLEAHGTFSHIRYRDPASGQIREGWAASGYLVKIVRPTRTK